MRVLITGARGMLAQAVRERFSENELILTDVTEGEGVSKLDITDAEGVKKFVQDARPEVIINCAAYTDADKAETHEEITRLINAIGPENLAKVAESVDATLVHISTDYVFGGDKPVEEVYSEDDEKRPNLVYGVTKLEGEQLIAENCSKYYTFRTAWLFGEGDNFVRTMLALAKNRKVVSVVSDQHGSPTYAEDLADMIYQAIEKKIPYGVYNATNLGYTTWDEFTRKIYEFSDTDCAVKSISSEEYEEEVRKTSGGFARVAKRPKNSQMSKEKLTAAGVKIRSWEEALRDYLRKEEYDK